AAACYAWINDLMLWIEASCAAMKEMPRNESQNHGYKSSYITKATVNFNPFTIVCRCGC
ncbi:hypothetical protein HN873_006116, partial [Arachis hypogaea]